MIKLLSMKVAKGGNHIYRESSHFYFGINSFINLFSFYIHLFLKKSDFEVVKKTELESQAKGKSLAFLTRNASILFS